MKQRNLIIGPLLLLTILAPASCAGTAWNRAVREHSILAYERYQEQYPGGPHREECLARLAALRKDPEKVAERDHALWMECMEPLEKELEKTSREYEKEKNQRISETRSNVSGLEKEVREGREDCFLTESVCVEWTRKGGVTPGAHSQQVCSKWKNEKRKDFACLHYWEGKQREYEMQIGELKGRLEDDIQKLAKRYHADIETRKHHARRACKKHATKDVLKYYPNVRPHYR